MNFCDNSQAMTMLQQDQSCDVDPGFYGVLVKITFSYWNERGVFAGLMM